MADVGSHSEKEKTLLYTAVQDSCKTLEASKIEATGIKTFRCLPVFQPLRYKKALHHIWPKAL